MLRLYTLCFLLFLSQLGWSQLSTAGRPYSFDHDLETEPALITMPEIDIPALLAEDEIDLSYNLPLRFAFGHEVSLTMENAGTWTEMDNGDRMWRLSIHCPDALNINLLYSDFFLPKGAELYLYNGKKDQVIGAFTHLNNKENRRFATALIHGELLTLEYLEPATVKGQGSITIAQVSHGYRNLNGSTAMAKASGDCQVNVNCPEGNKWQDEKKGVARILMDGLYLCSGSLVTNTANDCKPLFLTANHCLMGGIKQDAIINPDVSGYVFYWNYEYASCSNSGPLPEQTTSGGTVLANAGLMETGMHTLLSSDFALIELDENPRGAYDVYFNGWDATGEQGETGVGIHHPAGDAKKISTHSVSPLDDGYYWELYWDATENGHSVTEGGSSGSALFRENGLIIGQLFGGGSVNCDDPANDLGMYGQLSYSWTNADDLLSSDPRRRLNVWLDPVGQGSIRSMEGTYDPCEVPKVYLKTVSTTVSEENATTADGCRAYTDYTYELGITPYPTQTVEATLFADGTADAGSAFDYELLTSSVQFNNVTNTQSFTLRVYDDAYSEEDENIMIGFSALGSNGLTVGTLAANAQQEIIILSGDEVPNNHVQTVRNDDQPDEAYLGPFGKVYFTDPGSGGMMMVIENLSSHDYGCVTVAVDQAGGTANNSWATGTSLSKTLRLTADHPATDAPVSVGVYVDDSELTGWEWFNNAGHDADDLELLTFTGAATTANENTANSTNVSHSSYNNEDTRLDASLGGIHQAQTGIAMGRLNPGAFNGNGINAFQQTNTGTMTLRPNVTRSKTDLSWKSMESGEAMVRLVDGQGVVHFEREVAAEKGFNNFPIEMSRYPAGIYFVQLIQSGNPLRTERLVRIQ